MKHKKSLFRTRSYDLRQVAAEKFKAMGLEPISESEWRTGDNKLFVRLYQDFCGKKPQLKVAISLTENPTYPPHNVHFLTALRRIRSFIQYHIDPPYSSPRKVLFKSMQNRFSSEKHYHV